MTIDELEHVGRYVNGRESKVNLYWADLIKLLELNVAGKVEFSKDLNDMVFYLVCLDEVSHDETFPYCLFFLIILLQGNQFFMILGIDQKEDVPN